MCTALLFDICLFLGSLYHSTAKLNSPNAQRHFRLNALDIRCYALFILYDLMNDTGKREVKNGKFLIQQRGHSSYLFPCSLYVGFISI